MNSDRKARVLLVTTFLNGALFLLSANTYLFSGKILFGIVVALAAAFNLITGIKMIKGQQSTFLNYGISVLNIIVAIVVAVDYFRAGTKYIQYVWIFAALLSLIAFLIQLKKTRQKEQPTA